MKITANRAISLFIFFITISYTGIFAGYHGCLALICCFILLFLFALSVGLFHINLRFCSPLWLLLFLHLCLNCWLNIPKSFLYIILFCGSILVMIRVTDAREIECIIKLFKIAAVILAGSILLQAYMPTFFYAFAVKWFFYSNQYDIMLHLGNGCHQYAGLFYEVSFSALILSIGCIICFTELNFNKCGRIKNLLMIMLMYYGVILTGKRSFMLILPVLLSAFWIFSSYGNISLMRIIVIFGFVFVLFWKADTVFSLISNILTKGQGSTIELSSREQYWRLALDMFQENWFMGNGVNSFDIRFNMAGIKKTELDFAGAHNSYIQLLAETGIIGTFLYVSGIFTVILSGLREMSFRYKKYNQKMVYNSMSVLILFLIMIYGITGNVLYQPQQVIMVFLFLGMILNIKKINHSDFKRKSKIRLVLR